MQAVLESILTFFQSIVSFLSNIIGGFIQLVLLIPKALYFIGVAMGSLPAVLTVFAVAFISVAVVYLVIGR